MERASLYVRAQGSRPCKFMNEAEDRCRLSRSGLLLVFGRGFSMTEPGHPAEGASAREYGLLLRLADRRHLGCRLIARAFLSPPPRRKA